MNLKSVPTELKASPDGSFDGYAAYFGNRDVYGDVIIPGAFTRTLTNNDRGRVKVLWQHDSSEPIGLPVEMREDDRGLFVKATIADTSRGRDALALIRAGVVNELSIGYDTVRAEQGETGERKLLEIRLWEFSPVTWAANELAKITSVKNVSDLDAVLDRLDRLEWAHGRLESDRLRGRVKAAINQLDQLLHNPVATPSGTPQATEAAPDTVHALLGTLSALKHQTIATRTADELRAFGETLRSKNES